MCRHARLLNLDMPLQTPVAVVSGLEKGKSSVQRIALVCQGISAAQWLHQDGVHDPRQAASIL